MKKKKKKSKVVNINIEPFDVYIGRPSKWGNPFRIGKDGTRMEVISKYEKYVRSNQKMLAEVEELRGKTLGCFCAPKPCHGDVLIKILHEIENDEKLKTFFAEEKEL
jgi:hypothetical protein